MATLLLFVAITKLVRRLGNKNPKTSFIAKDERVRRYRFIFLYSLIALSPSPHHIELHPSRRHHLQSESSLSLSLSLVTIYRLSSLISLILCLHCKVCDFSYLVNHCSIDWFRISNLYLWVLFIYFFSTKNTIGLIGWVCILCLVM